MREPVADAPVLYELRIARIPPAPLVLIFRFWGSEISRKYFASARGLLSALVRFAFGILFGFCRAAGLGQRPDRCDLKYVHEESLLTGRIGGRSLPLETKISPT